MGYFRNRTPISTDDPYNDQKIMKISRSNRRAEKDTQYFPTYSEVRIKHVRSKIWTLRGNLMIHLTILRELIFFQVSIPFPQVHTICGYVLCMHLCTAQLPVYNLSGAVHLDRTSDFVLMNRMSDPGSDANNT